MKTDLNLNKMLKPHTELASSLIYDGISQRVRFALYNPHMGL